MSLAESFDLLDTKLENRVKRCSSANETYFSYLREFTVQIMKDRKRRKVDQKRDDHTVARIFLGRTDPRTKKALKELKDMKQPGALYPTDLDSFYQQIWTSLYERGWLGISPQGSSN